MIVLTVLVSGGGHLDLGWDSYLAKFDLHVVIRAKACGIRPMGYIGCGNST